MILVNVIFWWRVVKRADMEKICKTGRTGVSQVGACGVTKRQASARSPRRAGHTVGFQYDRICKVY